jgi:hypothetical protein
VRRVAPFPFLFKQNEKSLRQGIVAEHDEQVEAIDTEDRERLEQPRLIPERVADEEPSAKGGNETADHFEADPANCAFEDEPTVIGALVEEALVLINEEDQETGQQRDGRHEEAFSAEHWHE